MPLRPTFCREYVASSIWNIYLLITFYYFLIPCCPSLTSLLFKPRVKILSHFPKLTRAMQVRNKNKIMEHINFRVVF